jgi:hypothetical protein
MISTRKRAAAIFRIFREFAILVGVLYAAFSFIFRFSNLQSIGLGLVIAIAVDWASSRKPPEQPQFNSHRLSIQFNLFPMLMDLGLIHSEEDWKSLPGERPSHRLWEANSIYHHSVIAYVINNAPRLVHFPILQYYTEEWHFDIALENLRRGDRFMGWAPEVFIKPSSRGGLQGYHIGLRVNERWWKDQKSSVPPGVVLHEDAEWNFGTVRLTLAVLPWQITHAYYGEVGKNHQTEIKALVAKNAWQNEDLGGEEVGYFGESYEHKYARVWAQHLFPY